MFKTLQNNICTGIFSFLTILSVQINAITIGENLRIPVYLNNDTEIEFIIQKKALSPVTALEFVNNNQQLITGGYGEILIWDLLNARLKKRIELNESAGNIRCLCNAGNKHLLVGGGLPAINGYLALVSMETGEIVWEKIPTEDMVTSLVINKKKEIAVIGDASGGVIVLNVNTGKIEKILPAAADEISCVSFMTGDSILGFSSLSGELKIWDINRDQIMMERTIKTPITGFHFVKNRQILYATNNKKDQGTLESLQVVRDGINSNIRNTNRGDRVLAESVESGFTGMTMNQKMTMAFMPCSNGKIQIYKSWVKNELQPVNADGATVTAITLSSGSNIIATGDFDGTIVIRDINGKRLLTLCQLEAKTNRFLIMNRQGFYTGSDGVETKISLSDPSINVIERKNVNRVKSFINTFFKYKK